MKSIVTVTMNPTIDKSAAVWSVVPERKLRCHSPGYEPGGGGINVSRAIGRLGGEARALYTAGGLQGRLLGDLLAGEGMECLPMPVAEATRENLIVFEESTKLQFRFGMPGPTLAPEEWEGSLALLAGLSPAPDYVVASGSLPPGVPEDFYARLARAAKARGARVIVDTSGKALAPALAEGVFLVKPNVGELRELAGEGVEEETLKEEAARGLLAKGQSEVVVVSLGAAGAFAVWQGGGGYFRAPTVPIQSKVGAGDSMVPAMVLGLARGGSLEEAVRFGVAAGAAAVMTPGTELCRREDVERLYEAVKAA